MRGRGASAVRKWANHILTPSPADDTNTRLLVTLGRLQGVLYSMGSGRYRGIDGDTLQDRLTARFDALGYDAIDAMNAARFAFEARDRLDTILADAQRGLVDSCYASRLAECHWHLLGAWSFLYCGLPPGTDILRVAEDTRRALEKAIQDGDACQVVASCANRLLAFFGRIGDVHQPAMLTSLV